jgi:hypothetical protein
MKTAIREDYGRIQPMPVGDDEHNACQDDTG